MKVLHVETGMHLYGGALQVRYLLEGLKKKGIESVLIAPRGSEIAAAAAPFARVREVNVGGEADPRLLMAIRRAIGEERPDIVHAHSRRGADLWAGVASRMTGTPALVTRRVDNPEPKWLACAKYGMYQKVVTISEGIRNVLLREGVPQARMLCIPSAVDFEAWQQPCDREWFQGEFGVHPGEKVVAVIAQLIPRKGHRFLIEVAPEILKKCPETRFLILGQGPLKEDLVQLCASHGVADRVIFAGFRKDLHRIMPCLQVVVHPALMEGLGVSLLQAAAAGVPIVAARAGGIPEIIDDGVSGYLLEPGVSHALVEPVVGLLSDPGKALRFGAEGRRIVETRFSIGAMVTGYVDLYSHMAAAN